MKRLGLLWVWAFLVWMVEPQIGRAQELVGTTVTGIVVDPSGASVPGAAVTLTSAAATLRAQAGADGQFTLTHVRAATYVLRAEFGNLAPTEQTLEVGDETVSVRLVLQVAAERQSVEVSASSGGKEEESLSLDRNADRLNFEREILDALPASDQDPLAVASRFASPTVGGESGMSVIIDGVEVSAANLPSRALRRIRLNRNPYAAEFRQPGKARIEAYSEEGSYSRFHASASISGRNAAFEARNALSAEKPDSHRFLFDGSVSGPIQRKRMGFVVSAEHFASEDTAIVYARTLDGVFRGNVASPTRRDGIMGRADWKTATDHTGVLSVNIREVEERGRGVGGLRLADQAYTSDSSEFRLQLSERGVYYGALNDFRVSLERERRDVGRAAEGPTLKVIGAFTAGPSTRFESERSTELKIQDVVSFWKSAHSFRIGTEARLRWLDRRDASNFAGTFEYSSLEDFRTGTPFVFRVRQGNPSVQLHPSDIALFIQDEFKPLAAWSVTLGLRYSVQSDVSDRNDFAPRAAVAFAPGDRKTVIRVGAGLFFDRVSSEVQQQDRLYAGGQVREIVVLNPNPANPLIGGNRILPSIVRASDRLQTPSVLQASASLEREMWSRTHMTVEYSVFRGTHLLRSRNVNAPRFLFDRRPVTEFLNIDQVESSASSRAHSLGLTLRGAMGRWTGMAQYALSRVEDDTDGRFSLPADSYDLRPEWGRADGDQKHRVTAVSTVELQGGFRMGTSFTFGSGGPFDVTTGRDDNGDSRANDRPRGVSRNTGRGPSFVQWDVRATKRFRAPRLISRASDSRSRNVEVNIDVFNVWNRANHTRYVGNQSSPLFGQPDAAGQPRAVQVSMRYRF